MLDRLVDSARGGRSQVLLLRGEAGIGKTALMDYVAKRATGCRVVRAAGVQSEMELAFAGVHQLCLPMLDYLDRLPGPQREALASAFGLSTGRTPDRFLVALAVLSLLADAAEEQPLVCIVDDVQWLDEPSALTLSFVARRLLAEPIAVVLASRDGDGDQELAWLPDLEVRGLSSGDARALLDSVITGPIEGRVRDRVLAEARGNPLALLELPRELTPAELAFGFGPPDGKPLISRIEEEFLRRIESLPVDTRRLLLMAAVEPVGDATVLWRAAKLLGIGPDAAAPGEATGLVDFGVQVRFRHPLVRSAVHRAARPADLRDMHRALAEVTDPEVEPDRRAWHRAYATLGPDEDVAGDLERSAGRAQARGGLAVAGAFLARAAELTPDAGNRARRALDAAQAYIQAGSFDSALAMLAIAEEGPDDAFRRARIDLLRAQLAFASNHGSEATPLLLAAAQRFEQLDVRSARATYLAAFGAAMLTGCLAAGVGLREVARAARRAEQSPEPTKDDLLLDSLAVLFTERYADAMPLLKPMLSAFCADDTSGKQEPRWLWIPGAIAAGVWDDESLRIITTRHVQLAREFGALSELLLALNSRVFEHLFAGELAAAAALVEEIEVVRQATGSNLAPYGALALAAARGRQDEAEPAIAAGAAEALARGEGGGWSVAQWAAALLYNGLGRHEDAVAAVGRAAEFTIGIANWGLAELVEAAARSARRDLAVDAVGQLGDMAGASGTDWALGVLARSQALVTDGDAAEPLHREAIERLARTRVRLETGRAHLLYGEWLRGQQRRVDAREQLRCAHEMFDSMGAAAFAERARRELLATGETVRKRPVDTSDVLTAQEAQIARLAAAGETNPEIGSRLFISPRTVEYHLHKVFTKLDVTSRRGLRTALPGGRDATSA